MFCFPYAGGGATIYRNWPASLPSDVEVHLAHLPGRGNRLREGPFTDLMSMVRALAEAIRPLLDKPFVLFGHSMGAIISFELARQLRQESGILPVHLFASGRRAPQIPNLDPPTYNLPEAEFLEELRRLNGTPQEALKNPELMQLMSPVLRSDFSVVETYEFSPGLPLACPITAFGGLQDTGVSREQLEAWREQTTASFLVRMFPGDHFFLNTSQPLLLRALLQEIYQIARAGVVRV